MNPCCPQLAIAIDEDSVVREYDYWIPEHERRWKIVYDSGHGTVLRGIRFCPFCGTKLPDETFK